MGPEKMTQTKVQLRKKMPYMRQNGGVFPADNFRSEDQRLTFKPANNKFSRHRSLRGKVRIAGHFVHVEYVWLALVEWLLTIAIYSSMDSLLNNAPAVYFLSVKGAIFSTMVVLSLTAMGLYNARQRNGLMDVFIHIVIAVFLCSVTMLTLDKVLTEVTWSYINIAIGVAVLASSLMIVRTLFERFVDGQVLRRNFLVLGTGKRAKRIEQLRRKADRRGFKLMGFLPTKSCQHCYVNPDKLLKLNSICEYALDHQVDEVVIALDDRRQGLPVNDLLDCRMSGIDVTDDLDFFEREASVIQLDLIQSGWLIRSGGFTNNFLSYFLKRMVDIVVAVVLGVLFLPVMVLTALAIMIECGLKAPVFYTQVRVGRGGSEFTIYKFRSMCQDAEADGVAKWALNGDQRITRVGRFIRKYRIDEIPQIWNVLAGDMSLVGPRPERKEFVGSLCQLNEFYADRHRMAPGLTGWAQLCYPYGASEKDAIEKLKYDLYYIKNHGILLDLYILIQTVEIVLFKKGSR